MKLTRKKICMIIPSFNAKGGIASVVSGYRGSQLEKDFDVKYIETYCDGGKFAKVLIALKAYISFVMLLLFWHPAIIHIHSSFGGSFYRKLPFVLIGSWFKKPIINHIHGADFDEFYLNASAKKREIIRDTYNKCFRIVALSDEWHDKLKQIVDDSKIVVIENYSILHPEAIKERENKKNEHNILFLGFICKRKGCYDIPAIVEKVAKEIPDVKFVLAGIGDIDQIKTITPDNIKNNIIYPGWVRNEEKNRLLREADLFFLPSYNEGMPMSILDAMGYGLPVVSTTVGGIAKIVHDGKNGYICEPGNIKKLSTLILKILTDEHLLKSMSEQSMSIVKNKYSLETHISSLEKIYGSI